MNIGIDFGLLKYRLHGTGDWYRPTTRDFISSNTDQQPALFYLSITTDVGPMRNSCIELALNGEIVKTKDFSYNAALTFSYETNKLTSLSNDMYKSSYEDRYSLPSPGHPGYAFRIMEAQPVGSFFDHIGDGIHEDGTWHLRDVSAIEGFSDGD